MTRLSSVVAAALLAATASAQCINTAGGSAVTLVPYTTWAADDEGLTAPLPLGFAFPLASGATFTHISIESNGVLYLTNGSAPVGTSSFGGHDMVGGAGDAPRIAAYWNDLEGVQPGWSVTMDSTVPGQVAVNWINVNEYFQPGSFSARAVLYASGIVDFSLSSGVNVQQFTAVVGISEANGVASSSVDLSAAPATPTATSAIWEEFPLGAVDLADSTISVVPVGTGYIVLTTCASLAASHTSYGQGCYDIAAATFYELFSDATLASAGLSNQSLLLLPTVGGQYTAIWGGGTYVAPTLAATPVFALPTDDGETAITPSVPFPATTGPQATLLVNSNGFISWGGAVQTTPNTSSFTPTAEGLVNADLQGVWAWHDWAEQDVGSGRIVWEEIAGVLYVTWDNVDSWPLSVSNNGTMQFQFHLTTGAITMVWGTISNDATSTWGSAHLVGYSAAGVNLDPGSISLATALPIVVGNDIYALALSASPTAVSTPTTGSAVVYATDNIPEVVPGSGLHVGLFILSVGQVPAPGLDLGLIGAPGCAALVPALDYTVAMVGLSATQSVTLNFPAGVPSGLHVYAQSAGLITPFSLPGGLNAFGMVTSNGIDTMVGDH